MGDDDAERPATRSAWTRRPTPAEVRDHDEFRTQNAIVKFYAVIPLMIVAVFLPAGPVRGIWMALVVVGYAVWGVRNVMRSSRKRAADEAERAASPEDGEDGPLVADRSR
ncbi:hypothetical protein DZG00_05220 [Clavibacter lycopersici]|uniref:Uncharacterized protein n=1 Tax=Clavibacter lycopersici TaxID=2301718 RepID=A0A399TBF2_9MICO|nr:hypothetical protein [Clavibacter lycopersici]RIJ52362.1 hypothetical protein DZG00_05220 [Clavibacter lycopersici]RIJ62339.1 hypothetical protein DZG02_02245 [Clavibacter lycopersici]